MNPFCPNDGTSYNFYLAKDGTATTGTSDNFGCLSTHKGEQWLYIKVATPGDMKFLTTSVVDHDYAVWGPFPSKSAALASCGSLPAPVDCSFHPQSAEEVTVPSVQSGSVYILLIANYAQQDQALTTVVAPDNTAGYDCQDVIDILETTSPTTSPTPSPTSSPTPYPPLPSPPRNVSRCECWNKPDLLACPLVRRALEFECGGGEGTYNYECTEDEKVTEGRSYLIYNLLPWLYKGAFLLGLRFILGCVKADLGRTNLLCVGLNNSTWILLFVNLCLLLLLYLSRCFWPVWVVLFVIWLHVDAVMCIINRALNAKPVAKRAPDPPRSNLELFAYTNNKKGWKEKAYSTFELKKAKKDAKVMKKIEKKNSRHVKNVKANFRGGAI